MKIKEWLVIASVIFCFYAFLYFNAFVFLLFFVVSIIVLILNFSYIKKSFRLLYDPVAILFLFLSLFSAHFIFLNEYSVIFYFPLTIFSMLLAVVYYRQENRMFLYKGVRFVVYAYIVQILLYLYMSNGLSSLTFALESMIEGFSSNGVTSFLIVIASMYTLLRFKFFSKSSLLVSFLTLYICVIGYGRGSIISALILLAINILFLILRKPEFNWIRVVLFFIAFLSIFAMIFNFEMVFLLFQQNTKLGAGFDDVRISILNEYLGVMSFYDVLFGASYEGTSIITLYNGNPHNSFIRAHHIMGFSYLLLIGYLFSKAGYFALRKPSVVSLLSWLVLLNLSLRAYTEPVFFPTVFDCFFFVSILFLLDIDTNFERHKV